MKSKKSLINFDDSGYYFSVLIGLVILAFLLTYFSSFYNESPDFVFYFHLHSAMTITWIFMLILQPVLVKKKRFYAHRLISQLSYLIFPYLIMSFILLAHNSHSLNEENLDISLFIPFKDLVILIISFSIAIRYRKQTEIHTRGMIATGIAFIEPVLTRIINYTIVPTLIAYFLMIIVLYSFLLLMIFKERNQDKGRWLLPLILGLYISAHFIVVFKIHFGAWESASKWFIALPLT